MLQSVYYPPATDHPSLSNKPSYQQGICDQDRLIILEEVVARPSSPDTNLLVYVQQSCDEDHVFLVGYLLVSSLLILALALILWKIYCIVFILNA